MRFNFCPLKFITPNEPLKEKKNLTPEHKK